jgi:hypothetical protein
VREVRVPRAILPPAAGLLSGYISSLLGALWLRGAVPEGDLIASVVSPLRIAAWFLASAHGVPLVVRSAAGVRAPDAPAGIARLSELLGAGGSGGSPPGSGEDVVFSFSVVLVPITILAIAGIVTALLVRRAEPSSTRDVLAYAGVSAALYGTGLAIVARLASYVAEITGNLAPDLGLGSASGRVVVGIGAKPIAALLIGAVFGAAFAAAGGMSALSMRRAIAPDVRVTLLGWMRGLGTAAGIFAALMALGGIVAVISGRAPKASLVGLGGYLLAGNAVAAAIVLAHGASMAIALDAGPFTGWERMDLFHAGVAGSSAPEALWLLVIVPIVAGVVAGRFIGRRTALPAARVAVRFGSLWGLSLALMALLLRVRVLSSFSVGALDLGGGSAAIDPLVALVLGFVWGTPTAFIGARSVHDPGRWTCPECAMANTESDRFCVSCGTPRAAAIV